MNAFSDRDVRRSYDILQHTADLGLSQLIARDQEQIIALGLFDNEDDFVSECLRYNTLGDLFVGVNPRSNTLLDQYGGLRNRMRSVLSDVCDDSMIEQITGVAVPEGIPLTSGASVFKPDVSILNDHDLFFALGAPVPVSAAPSVKEELVSSDTWAYDVSQFMRVQGTAIVGGGFLSRRASFRRYRPYQLTELSDIILTNSDFPR